MGLIEETILWFRESAGCWLTSQVFTVVIVTTSLTKLLTGRPGRTRRFMWHYFIAFLLTIAVIALRKGPAAILPWNMLHWKLIPLGISNCVACFCVWKAAEISLAMSATVQNRSATAPSQMR